MSATPLHSPTTDGEAPPGWYADPANPGGRRYWDGSAWTSQIAPATPAAAEAPAVPIGLVISGYVFAVLIPIVGLILGLVAAAKHKGTGANHGVWIIVTAVAAFFVYLLLMAGGSA
jgi:hypothetical protein